MKKISDSLLVIEMKRKQILMSKPVFLGLPMLETSKIVMLEFWYDFVRPKYGEKAKLYYMNTDSFIVCIKIEDIYISIIIFLYIANDVERTSDT